MKKLFILFLSIVFFSVNGFGQTTYISGATANGNFENATTLSGWSVANNGTNNWYGSNNFKCGGTKGAYVGTAAANNNYTNTTTQVSHLYKTVAVPFTAGETSISLSFNYRGQGESTYDGLQVFLTTAMPVAGTACAPADQVGATWYNLQAACTAANITIPSTYAGTTKYLVFQWKNDGSVGTMPAITLDDIVLTSSPPYLMSNAPVTTCSGVFADDGNTGNYLPSTNFTKVFTPATAGMSLQFVFTSFALGDAQDYLIAYDGPTTASPIIGTYDNATSPTTITATNGTGQITFVWYSDGNGIGAGWTANIACVTPPPANDNCGGATTLTVNPNLACGTVTAGTVLNASPSSQAIAPCFGTADDDVWYKFVATATVHRVSLLNVAGSTTDMYHAVYSGTCGALVNLSCSDPDQTDLSGLTIGNTYYVRVYTYTSTGGQTSTFNICIGTPPPPPANDECLNATALTVNPTYVCATVTAGTVFWATASAQSIGTCWGTADDDVWYKFVATGTAHRVSLLNVAGSTTDMYHAVYSGTCGALVNLSCSDPDQTDLTGLTIGNTYYVRVYTYTSTGGQTSTFDVCVGTPPPPPANDNCAGSVVLTVNPDLLCGTVTPGTVQSATNSGPVGCTGTADDDVWFSFVATSTVHNFDILNIVGSTTDMVFEIFSGACSNTSIACSDPNSGQWGGFTIGQTYHLRVYTYTSTGNQNTTFNVCVGTPPPPPTNDEPCGALTLNVNSGSCSYQSAVLSTSSSVSAGMPAPGCGSLGPDIWFKVTVPASGRLIVDMATSGGPTDMDMAWYTGPNCGNLNSVVECDDADSQSSSMAMICRTGASCVVPGDCQQNATLAPGTVVYIRAWEYGGDAFGAFDICAYDPGAPGAPSNCASATTVSSLPFSDAGQTTCCRVNSYTASDGCASVYQGGEDYLYKYTPSANVTVDVTLTGTLSDVGVFITDKCPNAGGVNCVASSTSVTGNPKICGVALTGGTTYYIMIDTDPTPTCTPFNINISSASSYTCALNYTPSSIGFGPDLNAGTNIALPIDDRFSTSYIPIGFDFCFDGYQFNQVLVSSNGYLIFDPISCASNLPTVNAAPSASSGWPINNAVPNTNEAPRNSIMFPWQDIDPSKGGTIKYQVLGSSPNRRFVLTMDNIPYFDCNSLLFTGQVKLFETTNNIEVHITNKTLCGTWNGSDGILGLHNFNGTLARVPAGGHNYPTNWTATNEAWRFTCNCVGCTQVSFPVELLAFAVECNNNTADITWSTATESNNDFFTIERSMDAKNFQTVATVKGAGNSSTTLNYSYNDKEVFGGLSYYRLKQTDFDGKYTYSNVVAFDCSNNNSKVSYFPNPFGNVIYLNVNNLDDANATVEVVDILGNVVLTHKLDNISSHNNEFSINISDIKVGTYFMKFTSNSYNNVTKVFKNITYKK